MSTLHDSDDKSDDDYGHELEHEGEKMRESDLEAGIIAPPSRPSTESRARRGVGAEKVDDAGTPNSASSSTAATTAASPPGDAAHWGSDAPDGGLQAWLVVLGAWCTSFVSFGWINSVGTFQEYYQRALPQYSASTIAWIPSLQVFFVMAMGPIVGKLYDRYGPRWVILVGSFLHVFGLMMASISTKYYQILLSQGVCSAMGLAAVYQPALSCINGWFYAKRGAALGIMATGSSLGGVIYPIMISRTIQNVSYGWAMRACGFLILGLLIIANLTVKARNPPLRTEMSGQQMLKPFKEKGFLSLMAGQLLLTFGIYVPVTYIPSHAVAMGMDPDLAQYLVAFLNAASLFGRLLAGWASDRIGKYNAFVIACFTTGILTLALWIPATTDAANIAYSVVFGFFSGAYVSLIAALVAQISPLHEIGYRIGIVFLVTSIPGLITGPVAGAILAREQGSWVGIKVFGGVAALVGTSVILATRIGFTGWKIGAKF